MLKVLPYRPEYQEEIWELIPAIQHGEYGIQITLADQPDLLDIPNFYCKGSGIFLMALHEKKVVGTVALIDLGNEIGALRKFFVHPDYRGGEWKTGQLLNDRLLEWAREKNFREIYLGTTSAFKAAHRFYEKNGFIEVQKEELPEVFPVMKVDSKFYRYDL